MNNQQRAAMQMAYVFIESLTGMHREVTEERDEVSAALREALAQPQGEWVDLTDDEIKDVMREQWPTAILLARDVERLRAVIAKFKEVNK